MNQFSWNIIKKLENLLSRWKTTFQLPEISTSIKEIVQRLHNNLMQLQDECEQGLNTLLHQLYDKHKEQLMLSRQERSSSVDAAEVGIDQG